PQIVQSLGRFPAKSNEDWNQDGVDNEQRSGHILHSWVTVGEEPIPRTFQSLHEGLSQRFDSGLRGNSIEGMSNQSFPLRQILVEADPQDRKSQPKDNEIRYDQPVWNEYRNQQS